MLAGIATIDTSRQKIGTAQIQFNSIPSTNAWLIENPDYLKIDGLLIQAERQTNGRGRNNHIWSPGGQNHLFCSLVIHLPYDIDKIALITLLAGLSINKALRKLTKQSFEIKWPNDILVNDRKICGILCETKFQNNYNPIIIVGFGINVSGGVNQFPLELKNKVTTLQLVTNKIFDINDIREAVLNEFEKIYHISINSGFKTLISEWEQVSCSIGKRITMDHAGKKRKGKIIGLNQNGHLLIDIDGSEISILSGEITYIDSFYSNNENP